MITSQKVKIEESAPPMFNGLEESVPPPSSASTVHSAPPDSSNRTPNGFASHGTQYSPQVTPTAESHRTMEQQRQQEQQLQQQRQQQQHEQQLQQHQQQEQQMQQRRQQLQHEQQLQQQQQQLQHEQPRAQSMPGSPTKFAPQVNGGQHQSPPPNVYQPQPVRAQKEQIRYITRVTPPGTPIGKRSFDEFDGYRPPPASLSPPDMHPVQPIRRASAPDDSMSWLQKQQAKLREKKAREGKRQPYGPDLVRSPWKPQDLETSDHDVPALTKSFEPPAKPLRDVIQYGQKEPEVYTQKEPQTYAQQKPQTYALRDPPHMERDTRHYRSASEPHNEMPSYALYAAQKEPQTYASREQQNYSAPSRDNQQHQQPNGEMSWLELQQQKLRERQEYGEKPLYVDTSSHHTTHQSQVSPLRSDSGMSSPASQYKPPSMSDTASPSPSMSSSSAQHYGRPTSPVQQIEDLERSIGELESLRNAALQHRNMAPTPPNTYANYNRTETSSSSSWQSHQRPLNRQASDTSYDREHVPVFKRQAEDTHQAPSQYGGVNASNVTGLPPHSPRRDGPRSASPG